MLNYKKITTAFLPAIAVFLFYLIPVSARASKTECEKTFTPLITSPSAFAEAMTKGMMLSNKQNDLWELYRSRWFGNPQIDREQTLSDVLQVLKQYPELSKLPIQEQIIQFSLKNAIPRDKNFNHLLNRFIRINLNKINNLYQIEAHLNFWTTIMIYPKMDKQSSMSKAQIKALKIQYNQEFLTYLENFINSEQRQFIADSSIDHHTRVVFLYRTLERIRTFLEEEGKNTMPISRAMVDVVETAGFTNEFYMNQLKSPNPLENREGLQKILEERDTIAFNLGFQQDLFTELKESLLQQQPSTIDEANKKQSNQVTAEQLIEMAKTIENQTPTMKNATETLRLRALSLQESAFRSCLGGDCTTRNYFKLAFDPNFLFFTLTDSQHISSGQITIVLGTSKDAEQNSVKTAFLDNIHHVPLEKIYPMLEGIVLSLSEHGYKLALPRNVNLARYGISNDRAIRSYVSNKVLSHLKKELTQFKPHKNDYPFQQQYYRTFISEETLIEFDKVVHQHEFKIHPGSRYTPQQSPNNLSVKRLYEELVLQHSKTEQDQIRFINILPNAVDIEGLNINAEFVRNYLTSVMQDKEASFKVRKLSLYTLIQFEISKYKLNINFLESHLEYFTESEKNSIIGEISTWKKSHQEYKRNFITAILNNLLKNNIDTITNFFTHSPYNSIIHLTDLLIPAIKSRNTDVVDFLLKSKIDLNIQDFEGNTALHHLADYNYEFHNMSARKVLMEHGADPNIQNSDGNTALHLAMTHFTFTDEVREMLEYGADPNIQNSNGDTALHLAVRENHSRQINLLLEYGADLTIQNSDGEKALDTTQKIKTKVMMSSLPKWSITSAISILIGSFIHLYINTFFDFDRVARQELETEQMHFAQQKSLNERAFTPLHLKDASKLERPLTPLHLKDASKLQYIVETPRFPPTNKKYEKNQYNFKNLNIIKKH